MAHSETFVVMTGGRDFVDLTDDVARIVGRASADRGLANVFLHHTSASLILCENADPDVRRDLEAWMARLVEDGDRLFTHRSEGDDDMAAHIRSILTTNSLSVPVAEGKLLLGTWQGIYLWEHRYRPHRRRVTVTVVG